MNDLEQRLRHTLHELADTVPDSTAARADFERRLAAPRGIRRPALVAAAAVAVLAGAGIAVPLAMRSDGPPPASEKKDDGLVWSRDYDWLQPDGGPFVIATFSRDGATVDVVVWVKDGQLCMAEGHHVAVGGSTERPPAAVTGTSCAAVPTWPIAPAPGSYVAARAVLPEGNTLDSGPVPGLMVFMTSPEVEALEVHRGDGSYVTPERHETLGGVTLYVADFKSSTQGFGYTARDYTGRVLENAIT